MKILRAHHWPEALAKPAPDARGKPVLMRNYRADKLMLDDFDLFCRGMEWVGRNITGINGSNCKCSIGIIFPNCFSIAGCQVYHEMRVER